MDVHPGRLVAHDEIVVFVRNRDRMVERHQRFRDRARQFQDIAGDNAFIHTAAVTVDRDALLRDERSDRPDRHRHEMGLDDVDQPHRWVRVVQHKSFDRRLRSCAGRDGEILDGARRRYLGSHRERNGVSSSWSRCFPAASWKGSVGSPVRSVQASYVCCPEGVP